MYQDFQQRTRAFSYVFCRFFTPLSVGLGNETDRITGELVSGNYFHALGVGPAVGRVFSPEEDDRVYKGHPVVVLSYAYWVTRFAADPAVVGRKILVNSYPMVIVGVSAAGFSGRRRTSRRTACRRFRQVREQIAGAGARFGGGFDDFGHALPFSEPVNTNQASDYATVVAGS